MTIQLHNACVLLVVWLCMASCSDVKISITDTESPKYHVHPPDASFHLTIESIYDSSGSNTVYYEWLDVNGHNVGSNVKTVLRSGVPTNVSSPGGSVYVELSFTATPTLSLPDRNPGEPRSYGFVAMSPRGNIPNPKSHFGTVHPDSTNLYLPTFTKNLWWAGTPADWWGRDIQALTHSGKLEVGIFASKSMTGGVEWTTQPDDNGVISPSQLTAIQNEAQAYLSGYANGTNGDAAFVELGLEEELSENFQQKFYFENLAAKAQACRMASKAAGASNVKFIYQIAQAFPGDKTSGLYKFLASPAATHFDILSLHVYAWPNFPPPETFVTNLINTTQQWMQELNQVKPIWYTETGIPVNDPPASGFEDGGHPVDGSSKSNAATFLVKLHTMSLALGVERIFWYNYENGWFSRTDAEANFGMFDYLGYPLPTSAAQWNLVDKIDDKEFVSWTTLPGNVMSYHFQDSKQDVYVLWTYPVTSRVMTLLDITPGLDQTQIIECVDKVGRSYSLNDNSILVTSEPIFLVTRNYKRTSQ